MRLIKGLVSAFTVLARGLTVCPSESEASPTWYYGYTLSDFQCVPAYGNPTRIRVLSQVFSWCYGDVSGEAIMRDDSYDIQSAARPYCPGDLYLTNGYVYPYGSPAMAEQSRYNKQLSPGFNVITNYHSGARYMTCR
jgi:hypothetical protein